MAVNSGKHDKLLKKAINKQKSGKLAEAKTLYKKILSADSNHLDANYLLGTLLAEQGELNNALAYLKSAESISPNSHLVKNNLGNVYRLQGEFDLARQCYEQAISLKREMPEAYNNLAIIYRRTGQDGLAKEAYENAIALYPGFTDAIYNLGKLYWDSGQPDDSLACYQRALQVNPDYAPAQHDMGMCYMRAGEVEKAIDAFEQYLRLAPNDPYGARMKLAYISGEAIPDKHPEQLVQDTYEKKAGSWDSDVEKPDMQFLGPQHIAAAVKKYVAADAKLNILDIGCGTGLCGESLKPLASQLHGVDLSQHMLDLAQKKNLYDQLSQSDIEDYLDTTEHHYDLVTASGVLIFFGDLTKVLGKIFKVLQPNGLLMTTLYRGDSHGNGNDVSIRDNIHFAHSEDHIRRAATENGYSIEEISPAIHEYEDGQPQQGFIVVLRKP